RSVNSHRSSDMLYGNTIEQHFHIGEAGYSDSALSDFAFAKRMIRVVTHQRRQIERDRQTCLTLLEQVFEPLIGIERRTEPRELPHGPELSAIAGRVNAARIRRLAGKAELSLIVKIRQAVRSVEPFNWSQRNGSKGLPGFGRSFQGRLERALFPFTLRLVETVCQIGRAH